MERLKMILIAILLLCVAPLEQTWGQQKQSKVRCEAITKKGTRCRNIALKRSKYCHVHQANDPKVKQCKANTKSDTRCSRAAKTSGYCQQHYKMYIEGKLK